MEPTIEATAQLEISSDTVLIRVRRRYFDADGRPRVKGVIFRIPEEMLMPKSQGMEYTHKSIDRFEGIVDEAEEE